VVVELDGWRVTLAWNTMYYGQSFFIPSVNWKHDRKAIQRSADAVGCQIGIKGVVENEVMGLRVWLLNTVIY
jgi:hypothetical protein